MTVPINPYVAGAPLRGEKGFFGREDILRWVERELRNPATNTLVLSGQRRIGKTTLLLQLERTLPADAFLPIYFDLQDQATRPLGQVLADLADTIAWQAGLEPPDPDAFDDHGRFFHRIFLPHLHQALGEGRRPVFLLDEFDVLDQAAEAELAETAAAKALFPFLRRVITKSPRPAFIFVIGRRAEDLSRDFTAMFKTSLVRKVEMLDRKSAEALVRQAEYNHTLSFRYLAVERILNLTSNHPYFTQLLCQRIWERAYVRNPIDLPWIQVTEVEAAIPDALEAGDQALAWLWDGLPPAERVVASALAEAGSGPISQEELKRLLHESGVRVLIRELQSAPQLLQKWNLIEPTGNGYRFRVELLRRWIAVHKPLRSVQEELDHIEPAADSLYQAAMELYRSGQLEQAIAPLRQAVNINPNHIGANQLLADILLAREQPDEARQLLERLYEYQPTAARRRLVQALLGQVQAAENDDEQQALYERVLELNPRQPEATDGLQRRLSNLYQRAQKALQSDDRQTAQSRSAEAQAEAWLNKVVALYQKTGPRLCQSGQIDRAVELLHQATNPNHVRVNQLLAGIMLTRERPHEARQLLEWLYEYQPAAFRPQLMRALIAEAQAAKSDDEQFTLYGQVLELDPQQPEAIAGRQRIWKKRGDTGLEAKNLETALKAYRKAGRLDKVAEVEREIQQRLAYQRAQRALRSGKHQAARTSLIEVITHLVPISPRNVNRVNQLFYWDKKPVNEIAYSLDDGLLAVASFLGIYLYDTQTLAEMCFIKTKAEVHSVAFSPEGAILASGADNGMVQMWQGDDGSLLRTLGRHKSSVYSVAFSPDGKTLASASWDKTVYLWRTDDGSLLRTLKGHSSSVYSIAFSPDGQTLASGSQDKTVRLWRADSANLLHILKGHNSRVCSVAFSPDGRFLASASWDKTVRLWQVDNGNLLHILRRHESRVFSVVFSPDGKTLASGSQDKTVRLWRVDDGSLLHTLEKHTGSVESVAFSANGAILVSGAADGTVRLWGVGY